MTNQWKSIVLRSINQARKRNFFLYVFQFCAFLFSYSILLQTFVFYTYLCVYRFIFSWHHQFLILLCVAYKCLYQHRNGVNKIHYFHYFILYYLNFRRKKIKEWKEKRTISSLIFYIILPAASKSIESTVYWLKFKKYFLSKINNTTMCENFFQNTIPGTII